MDDSNIAKLLEEQGKVFEEYKKTNDQLVVQVKSLGAADSLTNEKLGKLDAELHRLSEALEEEGRKFAALEKRFARPQGSSGDDSLDTETKAFNDLLRTNYKGEDRPGVVDAEGYVAYKAAFSAGLRRDRSLLSPDEVKTLTVGTDSDGGYLVPADTSGRIVTRIFETSPMRSIASSITIGVSELEGLRDTDEAASGGWVNETDARTATNTPQIGKYVIPVHEMFAFPFISQKMLDDSTIDIAAWLATKVADRLVRVENAAFVSGDGVSKPRGISNYPTAATGDGSRPWGTFEHINTGTNANFTGTTSATASPADVLMDLVGAVKDGYLQNARWLTRREVITLIRKFKLTDGQYVWQQALSATQPQTILGFPVTIAQDMPTLAAGSLSMAFGDFREAYQIVDRQGFRTLRDPYTNKPLVGFYTTRRVGGAAIQFEAVKFLRFGT